MIYHKLNRGHPLDLTAISPERFRRDMRLIAKLDLRGVSIGEYLRSENRDKLVGIGFDDGYSEVLTEAFPILRDEGFTATVFPVVGYLGKKNEWEPFLGNKNTHLSREDLVRLVESGFELGSHTMTHPNLKRLSDTELRHELGESRRYLSEISRSPVEIISFPFSMVDRRIIKFARECGYKYGIVLRGSGNIDRMIIRALGVYKYESELCFRMKLEEKPIELFRLDFISFWSCLSVFLR